MSKKQQPPLPALVVERILADLAVRAELFRLARVCKRWRDAARTVFHRHTDPVERQDLRTLWFQLPKRRCRLALLTALERGWVHCARKKFIRTFRIEGRHTANKLVSAALRAPAHRLFDTVALVCEPFVTSDWYSLSCSFNDKERVEELAAVGGQSLFCFLYRGMATCAGDVWILDPARNQGSNFVAHLKSMKSHARENLRSIRDMVNELSRDPKFAHTSGWLPP